MIIITTQCFKPKIGGIEALMTGMAEAMSKVGKEVIVLADGKKDNIDKDELYQIVRFSGWKPLRRRRKARFIRRLIQSKNIEKIYADSWKSIELLNGVNIKTVVLAHGTEIPKSYLKASFKITYNYKRNRIVKSYKNSHRIVANSHYTKDLMMASLKVKSNKIKVIHPGVDIYNEFILANDRENVKKILKDSSPIVTTLARVEKRKGHKFIINAIKSLKSKYPNILYLIAGKGPYLEEISKYVRDLQLEKNVMFLGWISEPEKSLILQNSDLFAMTPSIVGESVEGFGMSFIDASFHGVALIGTNSGGIPDALVDKKTGLLCETENQKDITEKIDILLSDERLRKEMGNRGKERAEEFFIWKNKVQEYLNVI